MRPAWAVSEDSANNTSNPSLVGFLNCAGKRALFGGRAILWGYPRSSTILLLRPSIMNYQAFAGRPSVFGGLTEERNTCQCRFYDLFLSPLSRRQQSS